MEDSGGNRKKMYCSTQRITIHLSLEIISVIGDFVRVYTINLVRPYCSTAYRLICALGPSVRRTIGYVSDLTG
jgi:hypothetical protein